MHEGLIVVTVVFSLGVALGYWFGRVRTDNIHLKALQDKKG